MFPKRPKPGDTEDDLLAEQEQWQSQARPTVQIQKMRKTEETAGVTSKQKVSMAGARFELDLDEDAPSQVLFPVREKNADWLAPNRFGELKLHGFDTFDYSKEGGFPEPLDLASYYLPSSSGQLLQSHEGKSFFATEFDRLNGRIDEATCSYKDISEEPVNTADFTSENDRLLAGMSAEKIQEAQNELLQRLDPKMLEFLANRHRQKTDEAPKKVSKFKQAKLEGKKAEQAQETRQSAPIPPKEHHNPVVDDLTKELEVLDEFYDRDDQEKYNRLATDAVQLDFATKLLKGTLPRQQQNAVRLFDILKTPPSAGSDSLRDLARSRLEDIKQLYLEEVEVEGRRFLQFAAGLNPLTDSCWMLRPLRSVLDATVKRGDSNLSTDDVDIVRLSLLWTLLLHAERPSIFYAFSELKDFYVRLSEVFLLGSEVIADDVSMQCVCRLMDTYILPAAREGRLTIRLQTRIADLDAFAPFYEDLLRHYESFSLGNVPFARALIIGSYLNTALSDSLECRFVIWSPKQDTARQITAKNADASDILLEIRRIGQEEGPIFEEQHYTQYVGLLGAYAAAIRDEKVTRERNQLMFTIASEELGRFVARHSARQVEEKTKQFDMLAEIVRSTVKGKLDL